MKNDKQEFYESKSASLMLLLFCLIMDFLSVGGFFAACPYKDGTNYLVLIYSFFFLGMTVFAFKKYIFASRPYIVIDHLRVQYKGHSFMWNQIKAVSLTYRPHVSRSPLYLKLETANQDHWIDLRFISDSVRRKILDAIESHIPVQYNGCKYESNEQTIIMGLCTVLFILICVVLLFVIAGVFLDLK